MLTFLPGLRSHRKSAVAAHDSGGKDGRAQESPKQPPSDAGLFASLKSVVSFPASTAGRIVEEFFTPRMVDNAAAQELEARRAVLYLSLRNATSVEDWRNAAKELDIVEGNNAWKLEKESDEYDWQLVQSRLEQLEDARISCDPSQMLFLIRTALSRHLGGMGSIELYRHSHIGTKQLIERYIDTALDTLATLLQQTRRSDCGLDSRLVMEQLLAARQAFGRSALLLSGGGTFGMNHIGVLKCLWDAKLLPRIISGSSAGSIVCSVLCTRTDDELPEMMEEFCYGDLDVFVKDGSEDGYLRRVARLLKHGSLYDVGNLVRVMRGLLGDMTFQEAYNRTRRILNICISSASIYELPRLLNYLTAPNVIIWSAVQASCAVPLIFDPMPILAKDPRTGESVPWNPQVKTFIDGSVEGDLPMTRLAELFNVNHFIVSQVNPHVVPFLGRNQSTLASEALKSDVAVGVGSIGPQWLQNLAVMARDEAMHRMQVLSELGVFPFIFTKLRAVLDQRYSGDITIFPEVPYSWFPRVLENPTTPFMLQANYFGERATWPQLSRVQNHCAIEMALDDAVQQLRARIAFSPSQVNLRLGSMDATTSHSAADAKNQRPVRQRARRQKSHGGFTLARVESDPVQDPKTGLFGSPSSPNIANQARTVARARTSQRQLRATSLDLSSHPPVQARSNSQPDFNNFSFTQQTEEPESTLAAAMDSGAAAMSDDDDDDEEDYFTMPSRRRKFSSSRRRRTPHISLPPTPYTEKASRGSAGSTPWPRSPAPHKGSNGSFSNGPASLSGTGLLRSSSFLLSRKNSRTTMSPLRAHPPLSLPLDNEQGAPNHLVLRRKRSFAGPTLS